MLGQIFDELELFSRDLERIFSDAYFRFVNNIKYLLKTMLKAGVE